MYQNNKKPYHHNNNFYIAPPGLCLPPLTHKNIHISPPGAGRRKNPLRAEVARLTKQLTIAEMSS